MFCLLVAGTRAQELIMKSGNWGFNAGVTASFGTHKQSLGLFAQFYFVKSQFQASSEVRLHRQFRALGPRGAYNELVLSQGVLYSYGPATTFYNPFLGPLANQTVFRNSIAYAYNAYFNRIGTTQQTGCLSVQVQDFDLILENDLLAKPALDRFRTGAVMLRYQYRDQFQAELNCVMWTGQMGHRAFLDTRHFYNKCYMDTSGGRYTHYSHGILSAGIRCHAGWSQVVQASAGIDAEQVRNAVQNHLLHDMRFIPRSINHTRNCHIPMLDEQGAQYLYSEGQKIRKAKPFFEAELNGSRFY